MHNHSSFDSGAVRNIVNRCSKHPELTSCSEHREVVQLFVVFAINIGPIHINTSVLVFGIVNKQV